MDKELQARLQKIYKYPIEVKFRDFRIYDIYLTISNTLLSVAFVNNVEKTIEQNVTEIVEKLDSEIVKTFKRG